MSTRDIPEWIGDLPAIGRPAASALLHVGVVTLAQVAEMTRAQLLSLHGFGPKALWILEGALADAGLSLRE